MSELKIYYSPNPHCTNAYYLKSEADKVIAELKDKLKHKSEEYANTCRFYENELSRQKYKRCFKLARWCVQMMVFNSRYGTDKKWHLFKKWHKRWLELAEKFKEA